MGRKIKAIILDNSNGFTLVEVLIAMVIGTIIIGAVFMASLAGQQSASGIEQKIDMQQDVRAALDIMSLEISMASYNPSFDKSAIQWLDTSCNVAGANTLNKGIQQANASNLTVEMDLNGNGSLADSNEIISYSYAGNRITRRTGCEGGAQTLIGGTNVQVINNVDTPVFQYFDGNNNVTARIPDIRRINITLVVRAIAPDMKGQTRTMVYSTSVIPRNHVISIQ